MAFDTKTSPLILNQVPQFVRDEFPSFVRFLESYYEYLELLGPPIELDLVISNPGYITDNEGNPITYGGTFEKGELVYQYADLGSDTPTGIGTVYNYTISKDGSTRTLVLNQITGTNDRFVKTLRPGDGALLYGQTSGAVYVSSNDADKAPPGAIYSAKNLLDYQDIDYTLDDYINFIKDEYAASFPLELAGTADKRKAIKHLRDFYSSRGTENSFKFLFRIFFDEEVEVYYPEEDMLRASGRLENEYPTDYDHWDRPATIRIDTTGSVDGVEQILDPALFVGRIVIGVTSGAFTTVESAVIKSFIATNYIELRLDRDNITGQFLEGESIRTYNEINPADGTELSGTISGVVSKIDVAEGGSNFEVGDVVTITGGGSQAEGARAKVSAIGTKGEVKEIEITNSGMKYIEKPTATLYGIHNKTRFESGKTETIFLDSFDKYKGLIRPALSLADAFSQAHYAAYNESAIAAFRILRNWDLWAKNRHIGEDFYAPDDNRGQLSKLSGGYSSNSNYSLTATNLVPIPTDGLKAHWKMNYDSTYVRARDLNLPLLPNTSTTEATPAASYTPGAQRYIVPDEHRVVPAGATNASDYPNTVGQFTGSGEFYPNSVIIWDHTGHGHHAVRPIVHYKNMNIEFNRGHGSTLRDYYPFANSYDFVFGENNSVTGNSSIYLASMHTMNVRVNGGEGWKPSTGPGTPYYYGANADISSGAIGLMSHDEIKDDEQQTWTFWYKPAANVASFSRIIDRYGYFTLTTVHPDTGANPYPPNAGSLNSSPEGAWTTKYWHTDRPSRSSGNSWGLGRLYFVSRGPEVTGEPTIEYQDYGGLRQNVWHMFAITNDYVNERGSFHIYYADGTKPVIKTFALDPKANSSYANGYSTDADQFNLTGDTYYGLTGATVGAGGPSAGRYQRRAVVLGGRGTLPDKNLWKVDTSATGGFAAYGGAAGYYDEARYYTRPLSNNEIEALFRNPEGHVPLGGSWYVDGFSDAANVDFRIETVSDVSGARVLSANTRRLALYHTEDIPYRDANTIYKMSVRARHVKNTAVTSYGNSIPLVGNVHFGVVGLKASNNGPVYVASKTGEDRLTYTYGGDASHEFVINKGKLTSDWTTYSAYFQGLGDGSNEGPPDGPEFDYTNPANLHSTVTHMRPYMILNEGAYGSNTFPVYPEENGIIGVGATMRGEHANLQFVGDSTLSGLLPTGGSATGEFVVVCNGSIVGPYDRVWRPQDSSIGAKDIYTGFGDEGAGSAEGRYRTTGTGNATYIMFSNEDVSTRFAPRRGSGSSKSFVLVQWWPEPHNTWVTIMNQGGLAAGLPANTFVPDPNKGDFLVGELISPDGVSGKGIWRPDLGRYIVSYIDPENTIEVDYLKIEAASNAELSASISGNFTPKGQTRDDTGQLSSSQKLQDSRYYQAFSYAIRSGLDVESYESLIKELAHPAGMKMFGLIFGQSEMVDGKKPGDSAEMFLSLAAGSVDDVIDVIDLTLQFFTGTDTLGDAGDNRSFHSAEPISGPDTHALFDWQRLSWASDEPASLSSTWTQLDVARRVFYTFGGKVDGIYQGIGTNTGVRNHRSLIQFIVANSFLSTGRTGVSMDDALPNVMLPSVANGSTVLLSMGNTASYSAFMQVYGQPDWEGSRGGDNISPLIQGAEVANNQNVTEGGARFVQVKIRKLHQYGHSVSDIGANNINMIPQGYYYNVTDGEYLGNPTINMAYRRGVLLPSTIYDYDYDIKPYDIDDMTGEWKIVEWDTWYPTTASMSGYEDFAWWEYGNAARGIGAFRTVDVSTYDSNTVNYANYWKRKDFYHSPTDPHVYRNDGISRLHFSIQSGDYSLSALDSTRGNVSFEVDWVGVSGEPWDKSYSNESLHINTVQADRAESDTFIPPYTLYTSNVIWTDSSPVGSHGNGIIYCITSNTSNVFETTITDFANSAFIYESGSPLNASISSLVGPVDMETDIEGNLFAMYTANTTDTDGSVLVYCFPASNTSLPYLVFRGNTTSNPSTGHNTPEYSGTKDYLIFAGSDNSLYINARDLIRVIPHSSGRYQFMEASLTKVVGDYATTGNSIENFYVDDDDNVFYVTTGSSNTVYVKTQTQNMEGVWSVGSNVAVLSPSGDGADHVFTSGANNDFCAMAMDSKKNLYITSMAQDQTYVANGHVFKIAPNHHGEYEIGSGAQISVIANNIPSPISIDVNSMDEVFVSSYAGDAGQVSGYGAAWIITTGNELFKIANGSFFNPTSSATSTKIGHIYGGKIIAGPRYDANSVETSSHAFDGSVYWSSARLYTSGRIGSAANTILRISANSTGGYELLHPSGGANVHLMISQQLRSVDDAFEGRILGYPIILKKHWI